MAKILQMIFLFFFVIVFSQTKISVVSGNGGKPISGAVIYCNDQLLATTDQTGVATFKTKCKELEIEADFYDSKRLKISENIQVKLQLSSDKSRNIQKVVILDRSDFRALKILDEAERRWKSNAPEALISYNFKSYSKISIDIDKDTVADYRKFLTRRADSLAALPARKFSQNKGEKKDSLMEEDFIKAGTESQFFMWEKVQKHQFSKKLGSKITILDTRISGLRNPLYEFMATSFSTLGKMPRLLQSENRKLYRFFLTDTVEIDGRKNFVINYRTADAKDKRKRKFSGSIFIDIESYALAKIDSKSKKSNEGNIVAVWKPIAGKWFLLTEDVRVSLGKQVFDTKEGNKVKSKTPKDKPNDKVSGRKTFGSYLFIKNRYFDFETDILQNSEDFKGYTYEVKNSDGTLLEQYRTDSLTERERKTYAVIDSLSGKLKFEKKIGQITNLMKGNVRYGVVDFDISKLISYNKFEGLRLGMGLKLNEKFNPVLSPDGYFGYGFKDHKWKFGVGSDFRISKNRTSILRVEYGDDVSAIGKFNRQYWNETSILDRLASNVYNGNFYSHKGGGISWRYDLTSYFNMKVSADYQVQRPLIDYNFNRYPGDYRDFKTAMALQYSPNDKNIMTPSGKYTFESGYPKFFINVEKGIKIFDANLHYARVEATAIHRMKTRAGITTMSLYGGFSTKNSPIWKHFEVAGLTDASSNSTLSKISFVTPFAFYTMPAGTFYAEKFAAFNLKQQLPFTFKTLGKRISKLELMYSSALGDFGASEQHQFIFIPLNDYYQEAGLVWRNFFGTSYSVGFHYRIGHYQSQKFSENIGIQFGIF